MADLGDYTGRNRVAWNLMAESRSPRPPEFFRQGGTTLEEVEIAALPDVSGLRLLHLACANGDDSLSWAARGASVVGVDISDVAIQIANSQARAASLDATFVAADVYDLPVDLGRFDVVYASWGVVCWLPDLDGWARVVADRLVDGGTFLLCEHHPLWEVLAVTDGSLFAVDDYFGCKEPTRRHHRSKRPVGWTSDVDVAAFVWPVSAVVSAVIGAGLRLEQFTEQPVPQLYEGLGSAARWLPATYLLKARKD